MRHEGSRALVMSEWSMRLARAGRLSTGVAILLGDTLQASIRPRQATARCHRGFASRIAAAQGRAIARPVTVDRSAHPLADVTRWFLRACCVGRCDDAYYSAVVCTTRPSSGLELAGSAARRRVGHELIRGIELSIGSLAGRNVVIATISRGGVAMLPMLAWRGGPDHPVRVPRAVRIARSRGAGADVNRTSHARQRCHQNRQSHRVPHHEQAYAALPQSFPAPPGGRPFLEWRPEAAGAT